MAFPLPLPPPPQGAVEGSQTSGGEQTNATGDDMGAGNASMGAMDGTPQNADLGGDWEALAQPQPFALGGITGDVAPAERRLLAAASAGRAASEGRAAVEGRADG